MEQPIQRIKALGTLQEALDDIGTGEYRHIISLSGGKDSTALALYLKQNYPQIPAEYIFCDTGAELPETYEYLERLEVLLGQQVKRLSGLDLLKVNVCGDTRKIGRDISPRTRLNSFYNFFIEQGFTIPMKNKASGYHIKIKMVFVLIFIADSILVYNKVPEDVQVLL